MDDKKPNSVFVNKLRTIVPLFKQFGSNLTKNKLKGKNLLSLVVAILAFIIVVSVIVTKCSSSNGVSINNTDNSSIVLEDNVDSNSDLNSTEDSKALSISSENSENSVSYENATTDNEVPTEYEKKIETQSDTETSIPSNSSSYVMYCGKFSSSKSAEETKANIAISTGLSSKIISKNSIYSVLLGPFNTRDEAVNTFNKLDSLKLIDECDLEEQN